MIQLQRINNNIARANLVMKFIKLKDKRVTNHFLNSTIAIRYFFQIIKTEEILKDNFRRKYSLLNTSIVNCFECGSRLVTGFL